MLHEHAAELLGCITVVFKLGTCTNERVAFILSVAHVGTIALVLLATDASIWLFQFMRAMRNSEGEMIKNAHLLGFFRRICRSVSASTCEPLFVACTPVLLPQKQAMQ